MFFCLLLLNSIPAIALIGLILFCGFIIIMIIASIADYRHDKRKEKEREIENDKKNN